MAWGNAIDATESGACACALATIEQSRGFYAIRRAETFTCADHYIEPLNGTTRKLENCYRLEISGTDLATLEVRRRLKVKFNQAKLGNSPLPAIAVVGFKVGTIVGLMAAGRSPEEILIVYPYLESADIYESLAYAAWRAEEIEVSMVSA